MEETFCDKCNRVTTSIEIDGNRIECAECGNIKQFVMFSWRTT